MTILGTFLEELDRYEIMNPMGKPTGKVELEKVKELFERFEIAMINKCDAEQVEAELDRARGWREHYM